LFSLPVFVSVIGGQEIKSSLIVTKSVTWVQLERVFEMAYALIKSGFANIAGKKY